jgi:ribose 5-phosphate isomerase A
MVGVGTGSTVNFLIDALASMKGRIKAAVASSEASARRLRALQIPVVELNDTDGCDVYIDGADEVTEHLAMIKGGRPVRSRARRSSRRRAGNSCASPTRPKLVGVLGKFPLPVEVIPMARSFVGRELAKLGGQPQLRSGSPPTNGNLILDVRALTILKPVELEERLNNIPGVVSNGLFARALPTFSCSAPTGREDAQGRLGLSPRLSARIRPPHRHPRRRSACASAPRGTCARAGRPD